MLLLFEFIQQDLKRLTGVEIDSYATEFIVEKIKSRMIKLGIINQPDYLERIQVDPDEANGLLHDIGINVSEFFRNPMVYELLEQSILPGLIGKKINNDERKIRIWSAGCATGEEPYSVAILLDKLLGKQLEEWQIHIFGTDISTENLMAAKTGYYQVDRLAEVKLGILDSYFQKAGEGYRLKEFIRHMVHFSIDDLVSADRLAPADSIFGDFDLIFCRNVMIYFNDHAKRVTCGKLRRTLSPGGFLIIGESEWIYPDLMGTLIEVNQRNRIYKKP